jgi:hypothetical protein
MNLLSFIKKLIIFSLPVLLVFVIAEILLSIMPNDLSYKKQLLHEKADSIEILILGGSHTYYDLVPKQLNDKTFNMAYVSQSLELDYLLLNKYIDDLPRLKEVVLMVAYITYSQRWNEAEVNWRKYSYFRYYNIIPPYGPKIQKYYPIVFTIPFRQCLIKINKFLKGEQLLSCDNSGWCNNYTKSTKVKDFDAEASVAVQRHENGSMDFNPGIASMNKIVDLCKKKNIKILLISFPVRPEYIKYVNNKKFNKMISTSQAFSSSCPLVRYYNCSMDPRMTEDDFYDVDHLNDEGARKFTRLMYDEICKQ